MAFFEKIDDWNERAKVFGGWIVKANESVAHVVDGAISDGWDWRSTTVFVPDPDHEWVFAKPEGDNT